MCRDGVIQIQGIVGVANEYADGDVIAKFFTKTKILCKWKYEHAL